MQGAFADATQLLDSWGKPAWIVLMVLGFIFFWPVGLAILGYLIWSGRMGCNWKERNARFGGWGNWQGRNGGMGRFGSTGNAAFDEYRAETLRRLEDEVKDFRSFLEKLRFAKDKEEFDRFMADRAERARNASLGEGSGQPA